MYNSYIVWNILSRYEKKKKYVKKEKFLYI